MIKYGADKNRVLKQILGDSILIPVGEQVFINNSIITLNETALFIWQNITLPKTLDELVEKMTEDYDVTAETAAADIKALLCDLIARSAVSVVEN